MAYKITDICVACGTCIDECPVGAISEGDIYKIDENACVSCGTCAGACPTGAIVEGEVSDTKPTKAGGSRHGASLLFFSWPVQRPIAGAGTTALR